MYLLGLAATGVCSVAAYPFLENIAALLELLVVSLIVQVLGI